MVEKIINIKVKISLHLLLKTKKIDFGYLKDYKPAKKMKTKPIEIIRTIKIETKISSPKTLLLLIIEVSLKPPKKQIS